MAGNLKSVVPLLIVLRCKPPMSALTSQAGHGRLVHSLRFLIPIITSVMSTDRTAQAIAIATLKGKTVDNKEGPAPVTNS